MRSMAPAVVTVSALNATGWDTDLVCPAGFRITADHIDETTAAHGTELDAVGDTTKGQIMTLVGGCY